MVLDYENLRLLADSWGLVYLTAVFVIAVLITFRPGSKKIAEETARIPLRED